MRGAKVGSTLEEEGEGVRVRWRGGVCCEDVRLAAYFLQPSIHALTLSQSYPPLTIPVHPHLVLDVFAAKNNHSIHHWLDIHVRRPVRHGVVGRRIHAQTASMTLGVEDVSRVAVPMVSCYSVGGALNLNPSPKGGVKWCYLMPRGETNVMEREMLC